MTVNQLYKILDKLVREGHGRKRMEVCIDKASFESNLEPDGVCILPVESASVKAVPVADGDGFTQYRADGSERLSTTLVLIGEVTR